jgi:hypothetical protein
MRTHLLLAATVLGLLCTPTFINAAVLNYEAVLNGAAEAPANSSPGTGSATLTVDTLARTFLLDVAFSDLDGSTTVAHIHGPTALPGVGTAGVMTQTPSFAGFPAGVTAGSYSMTYDMSALATWNPAFVTTQGGTVEGAEAAFISSLASGTAYLNIHTTRYPGGEIRGFLTEVTPVPLPAGFVLSLTALAILGAVGFGRRLPA